MIPRKDGWCSLITSFASQVAVAPVTCLLITMWTPTTECFRVQWRTLLLRAQVKIAFVLACCASLNWTSQIVIEVGEL